MPDISHGHVYPRGAPIADQAWESRFRLGRYSEGRMSVRRFSRRTNEIRAHCTAAGYLGRSISPPRVREQNDPSMLLPVPPRGCAQDRTSCSIVHSNLHLHLATYTDREGELAHQRVHMYQVYYGQWRQTDGRTNGQILFTESNAGQNKVEARVTRNARSQARGVGVGLVCDWWGYRLSLSVGWGDQFRRPRRMDHIGP